MEYNMSNDIYIRRAKALRSILPEGKIVGVEIGVDKGQFSRILLEMYPEIEKIYGIDAYRRSSNNQGKDFTDKDWDNFYNRVKNDMNFGSRFELIRKSSLEAVDDIPNNMTFIYIDGDHSYEHVLKDIDLYERKVMKGGILCGHDYPCKKYPQVKPAVDFYSKQYNRDLQSTIDTDIKVGM
jgi:hypothetical protein